MGIRIRHMTAAIMVALAVMAMPLQAQKKADAKTQKDTAPAAKKYERNGTIDKSRLPARPNKVLCWFYRTAEWADNYLIKGIDTNYVTLPEHSWRIAYINGIEGINSNWSATQPPPIGTVTLLSRTTPSVDLGFQVGYRSLGFGYSWDASHAYSQKLNLSLGSKFIGIDFSRQVSTNITGKIHLEDFPKDEYNPVPLPKNLLWITNTNLSVWYALNAAHYSHQAAIKQSYIQKKTAGSLLLSLGYMSTQISVEDTTTYNGKPLLSYMIDGIKSMTTHQVAVGLGYGINYTPNRGKVLLHLSANAQLVCYSIDQVSFAVSDSMNLPGEPFYNIKPQYPVHITGNLRAAVSWEINPWVHLSAMGQANNIRFATKQGEVASMALNNWNWQAKLAVGVRLGVGRKKVQETLDAEEEYLIAEEKEILRQARRHRRDTTLRAAADEIKAEHAYADSITQAEVEAVQAAAEEANAHSAKHKHRKRATKLPQWITDYFYSPKQ